MHFKRLIEGETITLDDGTVVTPRMVMSDELMKAQDFMTIFMPSKEHIRPFLDENDAFLESLRRSIPADSQGSN